MATDELARARAESDAVLDGLHARILAVLRPRRRKLAEAVTAEIEQEAINRMAEHFIEETRLRSMDFRNGATMDIEPAREIVTQWVAAARAMLGDAPNYSETEIDFGMADPPGFEMEVKLAGEVERYVFRVQRRGKLTPHQARKLAESRAEAAEARLAEVRETIAAFFTHHGNSAAFALRSARDLAEGVRQVLDRAPLEPLSAVCTGPDCGEQFADSETGEYLFATRERMERLLYADGWASDPVLCPACREEAGHDPAA